MNEHFSLVGVDNLPPREFVDRLIGLAAQRVNEGASQTLTARCSTEHPPRDARHLTDTRTRVSTLLEYSVAYEMNSILKDEAEGYSISAVLWNVFPDLVVRDQFRKNVLGLEVKALHTAAEEKSANLATPIAVMRMSQDFIVILIWGWTTGVINGTPITYPHIHAHGVFDAWLLGRIRDYGWLHNQKGRVKGIDLCTPVINGQDGSFKSEEGNLGKLMRIELPPAIPANIPGYAEMTAENFRYGAFTDLALALGLRETFLDVCTIADAVNVVSNEPTCYPASLCELGHAVQRDGSSLTLIAGPKPERWLKQQDPAKFLDGASCLWLSQKLNWAVFRKSDAEWHKVASGQKPDSELDTIGAALDVTTE